MKKLWNEYKPVVAAFVLWRIALTIITWAAPYIIPLREGFLGKTHWANFDGVHYLSIAKNGYFQYEQAFFPFYSLLVRFLSFIPTSLELVALSVSHVAFFIALVFLYKLARVWNKENSLWVLVFLLVFPTSFFFVSAYTESLYVMLAAGSFWTASKHKWFLAGVLGALASSTRLFGIFLFPALLWQYYSLPKHTRSFSSLMSLCLVPFGLFSYMLYLQKTVGDALFFFHAQPAFGAQRSGSEIILLPQVIWRYLKIFTTAETHTVQYMVAISEFIIFALFMYLLWLGWRKKLAVQYLIYSGCVVIFPTLTGTLSSMPRYVLSAFPLFFILGNVHNKAVRFALIGISFFGLLLNAAFYLQGHFVS